MEPNKIPEYKSTTLVQHLVDTINRGSEIKYCFILGAGASKSSGISTGYELSKAWFDDIKRIYPDYQVWVNDNNMDEANLSKHYSKIYKKRFEINPVQGYEFLQKEMVNSSPSFGYSILSQLLETQHNVVITTNFDSLVEDALFLYSKHKPLICGHESLSEFVQPSNVRPIIIKVHRDLLLNPKNEEGELMELEKGFANSLDRIFQAYIPIVIGYGGNDLSLMNYLNGCKSVKSIFWCKRTNDKLSIEIKNLLENKRGKLFEIAGYDELMFQIYAELFKDKELDKRVKENAKKKASEWATQLVTLSKNFTDVESKESLSKITKDKKYIYWWDVVLAADVEKNIDAKNEIYLAGLEELEENADLIGAYAAFLHFEKSDFENAEKYYQKALKLNSSDPVVLRNYAVFLKNIKEDYDLAENYYKKAIENDITNSEIYSSYALFMETIRKNYSEAGKLYQKALELDAGNASANVNYIQLLISLNQMDIAKKNIDNAFVLGKFEGMQNALAELWFYCFANFYDEYPNAENELKQLIGAGVKSEGWDFSINVKKAKAQNHPKIKKVIDYAEKISGLTYN